MKANILQKGIIMASHAKKSLCALSLALVFSGCASTTTPQQTNDIVNASYSVTHDSGVIVNASPTSAADCPAGSEYTEDTNFCVQPNTVTDELILNAQDNGDLEFDTWINGSNGHICSANGIAQTTAQPNVWRFEGQVGGEVCRVDITADDQNITLRQDHSAGSNCSAYCGNRANFGGTFPLSSMK